MSIRKFMSVSALVGVLVALACNYLPLVAMARALGGLRALTLAGPLVLMVWPSAIMLMGSSDAALTLGDPLLLLSAAINGAIYAWIGGMIWLGSNRNRIAWAVAGLVVAAIWWQAWSL